MGTSDFLSLSGGVENWAIQGGRKLNISVRFPVAGMQWKPGNCRCTIASSRAVRQLCWEEQAEQPGGSYAEKHISFPDGSEPPGQHQGPLCTQEDKLCIPKPCVERHMAQLVRAQPSLSSPTHFVQAERQAGISSGNSIAQEGHCTESEFNHLHQMPSDEISFRHTTLLRSLKELQQREDIFLRRELLKLIFLLVLINTFTSTC